MFEITNNFTGGYYPPLRWWKVKYYVVGDGALDIPGDFAVFIGQHRMLSLRWCKIWALIVGVGAFDDPQDFGRLKITL